MAALNSWETFNGEPLEELEARGGSTVKSLIFTVRLLDTMAAAGGPARVTDLAKTLGEPKTKVHRHLTTLRAMGLVEQTRTSDRYRLGWKLYRLGQAAFEQFDLKHIAEPHMARLRESINQTVVLSIPIGGEALVISSLDQVGGSIKISGVPGSIAPATVSAQGRIMLAWAGAKQQKAILNQPSPAMTIRSIVDGEALEKRLKEIRARLYDFAPEEVILGVNAVAAPIFDADDVLVGSVGLIGSIQFIPDPPPAELIKHVLACAKSISAELGAREYDSIAELF